MRLELHVFYASFGGYGSAFTAAQALGAERPGLRVQGWDVFEMSHDELTGHQIRNYPTLRLYQAGVLLGESTVAFWGKQALARWLDQLAPDEAG